VAAAVAAVTTSELLAAGRERLFCGCGGEEKWDPLSPRLWLQETSLSAPVAAESGHFYAGPLDRMKRRGTGGFCRGNPNRIE